MLTSFSTDADRLNGIQSNRRDLRPELAGLRNCISCSRLEDSVAISRYYSLGRNRHLGLIRAIDT